MALGDVTLISPSCTAIEVLASATSTNGIPSTAGAGIEANLFRGSLHRLPDTMRVAVTSTAGSGTMTGTVRLWGYLGSLGWIVVQTLAALAEISADNLSYSETVVAANLFTRYYVEIVAIGGTATAVKAWLVGSVE